MGGLEPPTLKRELASGREIQRGVREAGLVAMGGDSNHRPGDYESDPDE